jgi:MFS transporter, DHA1 family, tetracycline resistance protein
MSNTNPPARLGIIFCVVLLDILSFSLLVPVLPYYALSLGATPTEVGILTGLYALCQFVGAPIMGRLSDRFGRKPMLLLDIAGSVTGFMLLGFASSLWMVFVARIIAGLVAANVPIAQAYISDVTSSEERSKAIALVGAAFGIAFTIGPAVGGMLSKNGYALPAFVSAGVAFVNAGVIVLFLPESVSPEKREQSRIEAGTSTISIAEFFGIHSLGTYLTIPRITALLLFWAGFSVAFAMFQQNVALFNKLQLQLSARETGYVFAYIGVIVSVMQGVVLRLLTKRFSDAVLARFAAPVLALSLVAWAFAPNLTVLLLALAPLSIAASTLITVVSSMLTKSVPAGDTGGIMGIAGAVDNGTRFLTAFAGGVLMQRVGTFAPGVVGAVVMLLAVLLTLPRTGVEPSDAARDS